MKFDIFGIIMMIVAVALGQIVGSYLVGMLGSLAGGIVGSLIVGAIIYVIYTFITGGKFGIVNALIFAVIIYVANMVAGYVDAAAGLGGGLLTLVITGVVASFAWGWIGGKAAGKAKLPGMGKASK